MNKCPACGATLAKKQSDYGVIWSCESCQSWLISLSVLRRTIESSFLNRLWQEVRSGGPGQGANCPMCSKPMNQVFMGTPESSLAYLICKTCNLCWLGPRERGAMPVQSKPEPMSPAVPEIPKNELPPEAAKLAAIHQVELIAERAKRENQFNAVHLPLWQKVLAIIGMPVEDDSESLKSFPWCTTLLALATMACSIGFIYFGDFRSFEYYGFVPRDYDRDGGLTFLSSFLIHGGWVHLLGNMYFLFVFGQVVEDKIGWLGFLVLVILSTAGGNLCTLYFDPVSDIPNVGASGGIAGILLFYGFTFPRKRIVFYALWMPRLIRVPAWAALGLWVLLQLFGASFQVAGMTSVSYSSHLGGLSTGFLCWLAWRLFHSTAGPGKVE